MLDAKSAERKYAEFYSLYTADFKHDVAVYLELAAKHAGPILEIGCATGRVMGHLAAAGYRMHGIDTSRPMLELARRHIEPWEARASLADFDLRQAPLQERFGVALVTLYSFNTLIEIEEQRLFLRHLLRSLKSERVVAFDLFCPSFLVRGEGAGDWKEIEHTVGERRIAVRDRREMLTPLLERRTQVFQVDGAPETSVVTHRRYIPPQHGVSLLLEAGFDEVVCVSGYDLSSGVCAPDASPNGPFMLIAR